ncbi:MAG TPA: hypothetical protein VE957_07440 [Terriglobales bacterium]|nr:hypothetical protein [Terriglobales bacterium]
MPGQERISSPAGQRVPGAPRTSFWAMQAEFYHRLKVQRSIVVMVLAVAAYLQYYLVNVPIADLSQTTKFSPATVKAAEQVVSFKNPETDAGSFELGFDQPAESQKQRMVVDAYFDQASLSDETVHKLASLGVHAPPDAAAISYLTAAVANGSCTTAVQVQTSGISGQARAAEFSQSELAPSDRHRLLEVRMKGLDSTVTLSSQGTFDAISSASSCKVTLRVGNWQQITGGFVPVVVKVPAGSGYRLRWEAADIQPSGWNTGGPALPLLAFGRGHRQSFRVEEIGVYAAQAAERNRAHDGLVAQSEHKDAPLTVDSLMIGTDHLQFGVSGKGRVLENGSAIVTVNFLETINKYPLIAALFGAANLGLLNWAKSRFFPQPRTTPAEVVPFPKEDGMKNGVEDEVGPEDKAARG